jgi:predicted small secreted protein
MHKIVPTFLLSMVLTGCVAVWGAGYEIQNQNADAITIQYDTHFASLAEVQKVAQANCDAYDKDAVQRGQSESMWGISTVSFACANRKA